MGAIDSQIGENILPLNLRKLYTVGKGHYSINELIKRVRSIEPGLLLDFLARNIQLEIRRSCHLCMQ
jgi:hypothetical protein